MLTGTGTAPLPPRTGWASACLALAAVWTAVVSFGFLSSYRVTATVVASAADGACTVTWRDPAGARHTGAGDCWSEAAGDRLAGLATWGYPEEGVTSWWSIALAATPAVVLAVAGGLRLWTVARRRARPPFWPVACDVAPWTDPTAPALSLDRTAVALRRAFRGARALTVLGVACAVVFLVLLGVVTRTDGELRTTGVRAGGTVLRVEPDTKTSRGAASVRFSVAGDEQVRSVDLGAYADDYAAGDRVTVVLDAADPSRLTIDDIPWEPSWTEWPMAVAFVGALFGPLAAAWVSVDPWRTGRVLRRSPWRQVRVRVTVDGRHLHLTTADGATWRSTRVVPWPGAPDDGRSHRLAWCAVDGDRAVFSPDQDSPLVPARRRGGRRTGGEHPPLYG